MRFPAKGNVPYDAKPVGEDAEFIGKAEMPIDVHLPDSRIGSGVGGHRTISSLIGIIGIIRPICFFEG